MCESKELKGFYTESAGSVLNVRSHKCIEKKCSEKCHEKHLDCKYFKFDNAVDVTVSLPKWGENDTAPGKTPGVFLQKQIIKQDIGIVELFKEVIEHIYSKFATHHRTAKIQNAAYEIRKNWIFGHGDKHLDKLLINVDFASKMEIVQSKVKHNYYVYMCVVVDLT